MTAHFGRRLSAVCTDKQALKPVDEAGNVVSDCWCQGSVDGRTICEPPKTKK